jgi:hypothetical protein
MGLDLTTFEAALKTMYSPDKVNRMSYSKDPFYLMVKKYTNFMGKNFQSDVIYGNGGARSATFSNAQGRSSSTNSQVEKFLLTRNHDYGVALLDAETIEASAGDSGALLSATKTEFDSVLDNLIISSTGAMYRDGSGAIGQVSSAGAASGTDNFTLADANDVVNFQIGQEIVIWSATSGGAQRLFALGVSEAVITKIDRDSGKLYFTSGTIAAGETIAAGDYIFVNGDRGNKLKGLAAWLPSTAPTTGDSFFGTDRSSDPVRLAGVRYDASSQPLEEGLNNCSARLFREGASPSHVLLPLDKYAELQNSLGSKVQYVNVTSKDVANISFTGIKLIAPKAVMTVLPSAYLEADVGYMLQMDTWALRSLGQHIRPLMQDGNKMLRASAADAYEARFGYYSQLGCNAPGWNARIAL